MLEANGAEAALRDAVVASCGWRSLETLVVRAGQLMETVKADALDVERISAARPFLATVAVIRDGRTVPADPASFLRPRSNGAEPALRQMYRTQAITRPPVVPAGNGQAMSSVRNGRSTGRRSGYRELLQPNCRRVGARFLSCCGVSAD